MDWHARYTQQASWTAGLRRYFRGRAGDLSEKSILEVGCGTGAVLQAISMEWGTRSGAASGSGCLKLFGLDIDHTCLCQAAKHAPDARLINGDALSLPFPSGVFDLVFCHYLLLWLTDPMRSLEEMLQVLRPGGWLAAFAEPDYGGRVDFPVELGALGRLQELSLQRQGADPRRGRQLRFLFSRLPLHNCEYGVMGAQWQEPVCPLDENDEWNMIAEDLKEILSPSELEKYHQIERKARRLGERILFVPTFYAFGQK